MPYQSLSGKLTWIVHKVVYCSSSETLFQYIISAWKKSCYVSKPFTWVPIYWLLSLPLNELNFYFHICSFHTLTRKGKKTRSITQEPWLSRNKGHKEEFLRYRQLSKLSSAFACAAVFALCFLNLWITLCNRRKRVKTDFLQQRKQAVFLKGYTTLVGKWNSRKKPIPDQHSGQPPTWGYFDRLQQLKTLIRNSAIPTVSSVFV